MVNLTKNPQIFLSLVFLPEDLIAVGYGQLEFKSQKSGLSCCWSLKNPEVSRKKFSFLITNQIQKIHCKV